ncbi:YdcF family protein [Achromobacter sp. K91]|uniref:YdcF family protein n=1 Tax=Achromobacter sp. K91 TaxID=2292262 RepID=UPI000E6664FB|nr:YdcF family protein [Achromobacter sp. K91]RIJ06134.1 YdcF family protein [Achromobacter sp. K91]
MTLSILAVLVLLATCRAVLKWNRTSRGLGLITITLLLALGCGPIPSWLLGNLQSAYAVKHPPGWNKRNAIVLLGAGTERVAGAIEPGAFAYARIVETAELYNDCRKVATECKIIVSGGDATHNGLPEATVYRNYLFKLGIDATDILLEPNSMNTWQNAQFTSEILERYGADRVVLVSSGIHLRRSVLYFAYFGVVATPVRADYLRAVWSVLPLSYNFALTDFALNEYIGIARYYAYNFLGWNSAR